MPDFTTSIASSPMTQVTQLSLEGPVSGATGTTTTHTSIPIAPSPVTQITQVSLDAPDAGATETQQETDPRGNGGFRPVIQPTDTVLIVPLPNDDPSTTSYITIQATARVEQPGSALDTPNMGTYIPKMPHIEKSGTDLQPETTQPGNTGGGLEGWDFGTLPPGATFTARTENTGIALVIPGETGKTDGAVTIPVSSAHANQGSQNTNHYDNPTAGPVKTEGGNGGASPTQHGNQDSQHTGNPANDEQNKGPQTFLAAGTPVVAGGPPVTVDENTYSLAPSGSLLLNGATIPITTTDGHVALATIAGGASYDSSSVSQILGSLSVASAKATGSGIEEQSTRDASATASGSRTGARQTTTASRGSQETSTDASGDGGDNESSSGPGASDTSSATQSDSEGAAMSALAWPVTALIGVVGLLAIVL